MRLAFTVAPGLSTRARAPNTIVFRPDKPITELVFRLTANTRPTVAEGNRISCRRRAPTTGPADSASPRPTPTRRRRAACCTSRSPSTIPAGTTVTATSPSPSPSATTVFDRFGTRPGGFAYFGSAQPLLAWERGYGWHTEDLIDFTAESATSEAMRHRPDRHRAGAPTP